MKLEKFDYQIGNKKTKKQFIALGVLCIALIITVALYKTFATFSSSSSYNIISGRVANFGSTRNEVLRVNISKTVDDGVFAILYDDNTLSIDGTGYMKDFEEVDLIGEVLDQYITDKVTFTEDEQTFINNNKSFVYALFDYAGRSFLTQDSSAIQQAINSKFVDGDSNPIEADINMANSLMTKISNSGFDIDQIEIVNDVKNIGKNAFSLVNATSSSTLRDSIYTNITTTKDYECNPNTEMQFDSFNVEANLEEVGDNGTLDINARNISIGSSVTMIPNDLFAWYNGQNEIVCTVAPYSQKVVKNDVSLTLPEGITKIGVNAFYSYNGANLTLPASLTEINDYAFANYYGNDITIPDNTTTLKTGAFRDFEGNLTVIACPQYSNAFAPNANINTTNNVACEYN